MADSHTAKWQRASLERLAARFGRGRWMILLPLIWLVLFFLFPLLIVLKLSVSQPALAMPPYESLFTYRPDGTFQLNASLSQFIFVLRDSLYWQSYLNSLRIAAVATVLCLLLGYPVAYALTRTPQRWRPLWLGLIMLPFWTSFLIRVYAWIGILKPAGLLNQLLLGSGVISQPLALLHSETAVYIGIVYSYLPFMILPLYANLARLHGHVLEAAMDLGCRPWQCFWRVTLPLSRAGIMAGCFLVFVPAVGEFVIPDLLGGAGVKMIGKVLWMEFFANRDWPLAAALATVLLLLLMGPIVFFQRYLQRRVA